MTWGGAEQIGDVADADQGVGLLALSSSFHGVAQGAGIVGLRDGDDRVPVKPSCVSKVLALTSGRVPVGRAALYAWVNAL